MSDPGEISDYDEGYEAGRDEYKGRIKKALKVIVQYGSIDGAHHKDWVLDQAVRALTGCPMVTGIAKDYKGQEYTFEEQGESEEYIELVRKACAGEDGPDTYSWSVGIPP